MQRGDIRDFTAAPTLPPEGDGELKDPGHDGLLHADPVVDADNIQAGAHSPGPNQGSAGKEKVTGRRPSP